MKHDRLTEPVAFTQEDVNVRLLSVSVGFVVTLGLYCGPITRQKIAAAIASQLECMDESELAEVIDTIETIGLGLDDGTELIDAS